MRPAGGRSGLVEFTSKLDGRRPNEWCRIGRRLSGPCSIAGGRPDASEAAGRPSGPFSARASWTLFSPKSTWPASAAARTCSAAKVLEMATRRMEAGSRPARPAARAMRSRTSASRARSAAESSPLLLQLCDESPWRSRRWDRPVRASGTFRTRSPRRRGCLRSRAPCRAGSALRRGSDSPELPPRTTSWRRRSCRRSTG